MTAGRTQKEGRTQEESNHERPVFVHISDQEE